MEIKELLKEVERALVEQETRVKIKEISVGLSGVISTASYENLRPSYNVVAEIDENADIEKCFKELREKLRQQFKIEENLAKVEYLEKAYEGLRFYDRDGKKVPSVTSILSWDIDWKISEDELKQRGAIGTIIHKIIYKYLETGKWIEPTELNLESELAIVDGGSLKLRKEEYSFQKLLPEIVNDIKVEKVEEVVFNDEHFYAGTPDIIGEYKGVKSILDIKSGTYKMEQLAAYAVCLNDIKQLVVLPVGKTDNKSGFMKPIVTDDIKGYFEKFLTKRAKFRKRFGV